MNIYHERFFKSKDYNKDKTRVFKTYERRVDTAASQSETKDGNNGIIKKNNYFGGSQPSFVCLVVGEISNSGFSI